jgi:CRP-like cAMP-binding protein
MVLLGDDPNPWTAWARREACVAAIDGHRLAAALRSAPSIDAALLRNLSFVVCDRVRGLTSQIERALMAPRPAKYYASLPIEIDFSAEASRGEAALRDRIYQFTMQRRAAGLIRASHLAHNLSRRDVDLILAIADIRVFQEGVAILRQGAPGGDLLLVLDGKVGVYTADELICEVHEGSFVGEIAMLDGGTRSASVVSMGRSAVAFISAEPLHALMQRDSRFEATLLRNILNRLADAIRQSDRPA